MTLQDYLTREGLTFTAFAPMIGASYPSTVERYAKGAQIPGRSMMKEIVRVTNGEVMPNDFYGFHDGAFTPDTSALSAGNIQAESPSVEKVA
jgi:hypothetical protein